jgi:glucosamine-6-phosphate deaminase
VELRITPNYDAMSAATAQLVAEQLAAKPDSVLVLPTGNTPIGAYRDLAARYRRGELVTSRLRLFQLDEYLGIGPDDPRSLYGWNVSAIVEPLGIPLANVVRLPGDTDDPRAAGRAYDRQVEEAGGFDLAVLGLGPNGHLGYNEPPAERDAPTRVVELTESSLETGAQYWGSRDQVPRRALTAGMRQLLAARHIVLIVSGAHKRDILRQALEGPVTPDVPASWLQQAPNVTVIADEAAWPS